MGKTHASAFGDVATELLIAAMKTRGFLLHTTKQKLALSTGDFIEARGEITCGEL